MAMKWLVTSDWHLTDRVEHAYRLRFVEWLIEQSMRPDVDRVFILGDLSDAKDRHSGVFVNTVADALHRLSIGAQVHILFGNHDGPSRDCPYWEFLGKFDQLHYYTAFTHDLLEVRKPNGMPANPLICAFVPWGAEKDLFFNLNEGSVYDYIFMHASVYGARVENGMTLEGEIPNRFLKDPTTTKVFSGDIHLPQVIGDVEYVGAPYHVHYGDPFKGRVLELDPLTKTYEELHFDSPRLHALKINHETRTVPERVRSGDRVKLTVTGRADMLPADWHEYVTEMRGKLEAAGAELTTATLVRPTSTPTAAPSTRRSDAAIVHTFADAQGYTKEVAMAGLELVKP